MNILLIEDNDLKYQLLADFLISALPEAKIERASSYQSGIERLVMAPVQWVLLDMSLPVSDLSASPVDIEVLTFGGQLILRETMRRSIRAKFIVISQYNTFVRRQEEVSFEQLKREILLEYKDLVVNCIRLDRSSDSWKVELLEGLNP